MAKNTKPPAVPPSNNHERSQNGDAHSTLNDHCKIAIVGMSCLLPESPNLGAFWTNIVNGTDCTRNVKEGEWDAEALYRENPKSFDEIYCKRGGFITDFTDFDPLKFGVMPNSIQGSDPDQLLALKVAVEALADAGYDEPPDANNRHEVIVGRTAAPNAGAMNLIQRGETIREVINILRTLHPEYTEEQIALLKDGLGSSLSQCNSDNIPAVMPNVLAARIAGRLRFNGRSLVLDSACASSLIALEIAVRDLQTNQCDLALAGGIHVNSFSYFYQMFCGLGALSRQQKIRPFDAAADGTILGEGLGMVVLKRLEDAVRDGNRIYAVICGVASSSDGHGTSMLAPSPVGEALALSRAYEGSGISPRSVELLEAHGTGTPSGDLVELQAIESVFGTAEQDSAWCAIGSVKSMIGHCQAASGIAGLIKTALSLYHRVLPATLNVETPTDQIDWGTSACYINTQTRPWIHGKVHPQIAQDAPSLYDPEKTTVRRAAVSAFGFGGINAHAVLEEFDEPKEAETQSLIKEWPTELCHFTGQSFEELKSHLIQVKQYLDSHPNSILRNVAFTLGKKAAGLKSTAAYSLSVVAHTISDLQSKLELVIDQLANDTATIEVRDVYYNPVNHKVPGKLAFVMPGLGAAYPNMLADLCINFPDVRATFDFVDYLAVTTGKESAPSKRIFPRAFGSVTETAATLASADSAVITVLLAECSLYTILQKLGINPDVLLGCSTGEFAAITMSGAVDILAACEMFYRLSTTVASSVSKEKLAQLKSVMVLADYDDMSHAIKSIPDLYVGAALCPSQTLLSGTETAITKAVSVLEDLGMASFVLPTAIPYHTPLVSGLIDQNNAEVLSLPFEKSTIPAWSCSQSAIYPESISEVRQIMTNLFTQPIMLKKTINAMYAEGVTKFLEVGPKGVLTDLIHDILQDQPHVAVASNVSQTSALTQLNHCLAELAAHGTAMDLDYLFARRDPELLDFAELAPKQARKTFKLNLQYPELKLPKDVADKVNALSAARNNQQVQITSQNKPDRQSSGSASDASRSRSQESNQFSEIGGADESFGSTDELPAGYSSQNSYAWSKEDDVTDEPNMHGGDLSNGATALDLPVRQMEPDTGESILGTYLDGMHQFHQNLLGMQAHVIQAYLSQQQIGVDLPDQPQDESLPLIRTNLIASDIREANAEAEVFLTFDTHRYLLDHAIGGTVSMQGGQPERVSLVPLTVAIEMMCEMASILVPGLKVTRIDQVRASKRIRVGVHGCTVRVRADRTGSAVDVSLSVLDAAPDSTSVSPGVPTPYMQCRVHFAPTYPTAPQLTLPAGNLCAPRIGQNELYTANTMFHGPRMQSVQMLLSTSKKCTHGIVAARTAHDWFPGVEAPKFIIDPLLLDNSTQPVLFHLFENNEEVTALLPFLITSLDIYADLSQLNGTAVNVYACLTSVTSRGTEADIFICDGSNNVLAKFSSITSRRISLTPTWKALVADPPNIFVSAAGIVDAGEQASAAVARVDLNAIPSDDTTLTWLLDYVLHNEERSEYFALNDLQSKREWLAAQLAAKDTVRIVARKFGSCLCPADVIVSRTADGHAIVRGSWSGQGANEVLVSLASGNGVAEAVARFQNAVAVG